MPFTFFYSWYLIHLDATCAPNKETQKKKEEWYREGKS